MALSNTNKNARTKRQGVIRMCLTGRSGLCLICLLLYTWLPSVTMGTGLDEGNKTTYSQAKTPTDPGPQEEELLQLQETRPELFDKDYYVNKLMVEFGNGSGMTFEGFEHLLHKLGLGKIVIFDHSESCHKSGSNSSFKSFHKSHNHSERSVEFGATQVVCADSNDHDDHEHNHDDHEHDHDDHEHDHDHEHTEGEQHSKNTVKASNNETTYTTEEHGEKTEDHHVEHDHSHDQDHTHSKRSLSQTDKCLQAQVFLYISQSQELQYLSKDKFYDICPSLIYQISSDSCHDYHGVDHTHSHTDQQTDHHDDHDGHDHDGHDHGHDHGNTDLVRKAGLSGVPSKVWGFSTIAVVIISLVGLLGVAVIPIMQKVFYNHMLQFLVALAVGALTGDALLHLLPHAMSGGHGDGDDHEHGDHSATVYKGLLGLIGIYFFFIIERILTIVTDQKRRKKQEKNMRLRGGLDKVGEKLAAAECDEMMMSVHPNKALQGYVDEAHSEHCTISFENTNTISHQHGKHKNHNHNHSHNIEESSDNEEQVDMLSNTSAHGHGHSHCIDGAPNSIAAVAWMVILGDGIHNFSDGLAIGAAFSNSITGGFSTSIAVFCHELPHEIGDFAMLLRAGMAPKQAIIYNCLSSILCFIGMLIGVAIGNIENASLWIFAVVGGMFLYIALVDMLPEMSSVDTKRGENPFCHLILQVVGMSMGASIMLVIALYEEDLKSILD